MCFRHWFRIYFQSSGVFPTYFRLRFFSNLVLWQCHCLLEWSQLCSMESHSNTSTWSSLEFICGL
jgi:hypothetical protein